MRDIIDSAGSGNSHAQVYVNQNATASLDNWSQQGVEKYTDLKRRYFENTGQLNYNIPSMLDRETLYEHDAHKNTYNIAFMDGIHAVKK